MTATFKKQTTVIWQSNSLQLIVLGIVALAQIILPNEIASPLIVIMGFTAFILATGRHERGYLKVVWPILIVLVVGLHGVFTHEARHILRDIVFALSPISLIFLGYWMAGSENVRSSIFKILMLCGFVLAFHHLLAFVESPDLLFADVEEVREKAGRGTGGVVVLGLAFVVFQNQFKLGRLFHHLLPRFIVVPVMVASLILSYSRTEFLILFLILACVSGWLTKISKRTILGAIVFIVSTLAVVVTTPANEVGTLRSKLVRSVTEVSVVNYQDEQSINDNWRAFETSRVMDSFFSGTVSELAFGQGFGTLVDMGLEMNLGGAFLREIPIFHNGYAYILIKTGFLGLFCYALFYIYIIIVAVRHSSSVMVEQRFMARLLLGCILSLMMMMYVIGGMAETSGPVFVLLLGYLVRRINQLQVVIASRNVCREVA